MVGAGWGLPRKAPQRSSVGSSGRDQAFSGAATGGRQHHCGTLRSLGTPHPWQTQ